jgi:hypothetical protein
MGLESSYENSWIFNNGPFETENIEKFEGFVYCITSKINNKKYIGRKYFYNIRKVKGKKKRVRSESDWKEYYGSSKVLLTDIEKYDIMDFKREILSLHITRGDCNYEEVKQQFLNNVLEEDGWYNETIGNYRRKPKHIVENRQYGRRN